MRVIQQVENKFNQESQGVLQVFARHVVRAVEQLAEFSNLRFAICLYWSASGHSTYQKMIPSLLTLLHGVNGFQFLQMDQPRVIPCKTPFSVSVRWLKQSACYTSNREESGLKQYASIRHHRCGRKDKWRRIIAEIKGVGPGLGPDLRSRFHLPPRN